MLLTKLFYSQKLDAELFHLFKKDDVKAFEELYNRYWPGLVNKAYKRINCREKAEAIVQYIFVDIYQRRTTIDLTISIVAYLNQALKFKILNEYQSEIILTKNENHSFFNPGCKNDLANQLKVNTP